MTLKSILQPIICASLLLLASGLAEERTADKFGPPGEMVFRGYNLEEPFNPDELKALSEKASRDNQENHRLEWLILRAGIEKNRNFEYLLSKADLRKTPLVDLALSGFDYMINEDDSALDHILANLATENVGADAYAISILSMLDEWDLSIRAFRKHFVHTDGAGASSYYGFMATRAYVFPRKYKKYQAIIEAPIVWQRSLIPKSTDKAEQGSGGNR